MWALAVAVALTVDAPSVDGRGAVLIAGLAALPPTIAAVASLVNAASAKRHARQANRAVNEKPGDAPVLYQQVGNIALQVGTIATDVGELKTDVAVLRADVDAITTRGARP